MGSGCRAGQLSATPRRGPNSAAHMLKRSVARQTLRAATSGPHSAKGCAESKASTTDRHALVEHR